jgi:hypothetical protein
VTSGVTPEAGCTEGTDSGVGAKEAVEDSNERDGKGRFDDTDVCDLVRSILVQWESASSGIDDVMVGLEESVSRSRRRSIWRLDGECDGKGGDGGQVDDGSSIGGRSEGVLGE